MFEFIFSAPFIVGLIAGIVGGAYLGLLMSRRSADANRIADTIRAATSKPSATRCAASSRR